MANERKIVCLQQLKKYQQLTKPVNSLDVSGRAPTTDAVKAKINSLKSQLEQKIEETSNESIPISQGVANAGKNLVVGPDGNITVGDAAIQADTSLSTAGAAADAQAVGNALQEKVDKVTGKGLSTNDFTDELKTKLSNMPSASETPDKDFVSDAIDTKINLMNVTDSEEEGKYVSSVSQTNGAITITRQNFPTASLISSGFMSQQDFTKLSAIPEDKTIATISDIQQKIEVLDVASVGGTGKYIETIGQTDGKITATVGAFVMASSTQDGLMSKQYAAKLASIDDDARVAAQSYVNTQIDALDAAQVGGEGKYISAIKQENGKISATVSSFSVATTISDGLMSKEDKASLVALTGGDVVATETFVESKVDEKLGALDMAAVGGTGKYISQITQNNGAVTAIAVQFPKASDTQDGFMSKEDKAAVSKIPTTGEVASKSDITTEINKLDVDDSPVTGKYVSAVSQVNGKISVTRANFPTKLPASDVTSVYSETGTVPVSGTAVATAINALDVASVGGAGKYISAIEQIDGKISATETQFLNATTTSDGLMSKEDKTRLDGISFTVTGGGNAITEAIDTNGAVVATKGKTFLESADKGVANGIATLDASGKIPQSQLPAYVSDIIQYADASAFPTTGQAAKIYVDTANNATYRWTGSNYVNIGSSGSGSLMLGTTSTTAYRGDYGMEDHTHATDGARLTTTKSNGLYKISVTAQGHIGGVVAVTKDDISALGIPDGTVASATTNGLMSKETAQKLSVIDSTKTIATTDDITTEINKLDVTDTAVDNKYVSAVSQTDGKIIVTRAEFPDSLPSSDVVQTYSPTGSTPISGAGVKAAIGELDVDEVGGTGKYIKSIKQVDGKIVATAQNMPSASGTQAGLMSKEDKAKLDAISEGATSVAFSSAYTAGTKIGTITIDGIGTDVFSPVSDGGSSGDVTIGVTKTGTGNAVTAITGGVNSITLTMDKTFATQTDINNAIDALDVTDSADATKYVSAVSQTNGKISVSRAAIDQSYSTSSTSPISGKGVAQAIATLSATIAGGTGKYIESIKEQNGIIIAIEKTFEAASQTKDGLLSKQQCALLNTVDTSKTLATTEYIDDELNAYEGQSTYSATSDKPMSGKAVAQAIAAIPNSTTSDPGLMSSDDKTKLDGISEGATKVQFEQIVTTGTKIAVITIDDTQTEIFASGGGGSLVTQTEDGIMSSEDKVRLDDLYEKFKDIIDGDNILY